MKMAGRLRRRLRQADEFLDDVVDRFQETKIGQGVDRAATGIVNLGAAGATPVITLVSKASKGIFGRRKRKEPPRVAKKGRGGVITGKKQSGPRGVGCAKRGYGKALS